MRSKTIGSEGSVYYIIYGTVDVSERKKSPVRYD